LGVVDEGATRLDRGEVNDDAAPIRSDCARGCPKAVSKGNEETGTGPRYYRGLLPNLAKKTLGSQCTALKLFVLGAVCYEAGMIPVSLS
jgi:hypothetical protein